MIWRLFAAILLGWMLGFIWFAFMLPGQARNVDAEAVIVTTGGPGRIERGVDLLEQDEVEQMFVSGVDPEVTVNEFAAQFDVPGRTMECCVTLGYHAVDTRSNASEAALWIAENGYTRVRLVTQDWHMRRALSEFRQAISPQVTIFPDAVSAKPPLGTLFVEYNKYLASVVSRNLPL